jgi:hypothetical protein
MVSSEIQSCVCVNYLAETIRYTHTEGPLKRTDSISHFEKVFNLQLCPSSSLVVAI